MSDKLWWETLDSDFHKSPGKFKLDLKTSLFVKSTAIFDIGLRAIASSVVTLSCPRSLLGFLKQSQHDDDVELYKSIADSKQVDQFFKKPVEKVIIRKSSASWYHFKPEDGECQTLTFESPFQPINSDSTSKYKQHLGNGAACAQHWRHHGSPRPTICVIHGFMADGYWFNGKFLDLQWFYDQGYDILLYTLPFHGSRQGLTSMFSGHGYFSDGLGQFNEAIANSVYDFRIFLDYLESIGVEQFGVTGISLGGYTTAVLAAVEDRLSFAIANVPVVSIADLILQWIPASWVAKSLLKVKGLDVKEIRHWLACHSPLTYEPVLPKERLMIVAGMGDRLAPPEQANLLWEHWGRCRLHWFPGNHVIHFDQDRYLKEMLSFMRGIGFK